MIPFSLKVCCLGVLLIGLAQAQMSPGVHGVVVSESGKPLSGVTVRTRKRCCPFMEKQTITDESGSFILQPDAVVAHFRADDFRPLSVVVHSGQEDLRIVLEGAEGTTWKIPFCASLKEHGERVGSTFKFLVPEAVATSGHTDVDYRKYFMKYPHTTDTLVLWSGPYASNVDPDGELLENSTSFSERWISAPATPNIGIDAVGFSKDGKPWRWCGLLITDSGSYIGVSPEAAKYFDTVIDSVCVPPGSLRPREISRPPSN